MKLSRRTFVKTLGLLGLLPFIKACNPFAGKKHPVKITVKGPDHKRGHQLRAGANSIVPQKRLQKEIVIVGGGVSGLSTAYHLKKSNLHDFLLLELEDETGGNSRSGANSYSAYPFGAHYLSLPNKNNTPLISFLQEKNIIEHIDESGKLFYNETNLCFDPEERLFIKGTFQDGLIPQYGIERQDKKQVDDFLALMEDYKSQKGTDGRFLFDIPISNASADDLDELDAISFEEFLRDHKFTSPYLLWYLNYCCRDDFGGGVKAVSARAGINYFASHKPAPSNTDSSRVLTWPEGNARLTALLKEDVAEQVQASCMVKEIFYRGNEVIISVMDFKKKEPFEISCKKCVIAVPPFIASFLINRSIAYPFDKANSIQHIPWMTATVTLDKIPAGRGQPICWDNVAYNARSLGYIYNQHPSLSQKKNKQVITLYLPLDDVPAKEARTTAMRKTAEEWKEIVVTELEVMHAEISGYIKEIEIWIWGHGMALPAPGLMNSGILKELATPVDDKLFFAHTDLSGYSVFEEGFDQGYRVAKTLSGK